MPIQEHSLTFEVLRKVSPLEAELLRDPAVHARVRFRYCTPLSVASIYWRIINSWCLQTAHKVQFFKLVWPRLIGHAHKSPLSSILIRFAMLKILLVLHDSKAYDSEMLHFQCSIDPVLYFKLYFNFSTKIIKLSNSRATLHPFLSFSIL